MSICTESVAEHGAGSRRGFSLLEVMVALAILTVSLVILVETQSSAVVLTVEAERVVTATDLAQMKLSEALLQVEEEGFTVADIHEEGDFDDLGDDILDVEFGRELSDFKWEYTITEVEIDGVGDMASAAQDAGDAGGGSPLGALFGGGGGGDDGGNASSGSSGDMLSALGFGPEQITEMLTPYIREVRVRVWWGESLEQAEEDGTEVVATTHVINPSGILQLEQGIPQ